ncbi:uncharacterized protein V3H82_001158 isoform 1-T1 [Fundulus diaphanus]
MIMTRPGGAISDGGQEVYEASVNMEDTVTESPYCMELEPISRHRYKELINRYVGRDPYLMKMCEFSVDLKDLPTVEAVDITNYLVLQTSFYTKQQMKAYKSMEAYNFFVCGWVHNLGTKRLHDDNTLVFARVNHSQRSSETPLKTWIIAKKDGEVIAAHCNCMAGLSESCSHVGAVLFSIEAGVKMRDAASCTTEQCKWLMPSHVKKIPAAPVAQIDFSSAKSKKKKLDSSIDGRTTINKVGKSLPVPCPRVKRGSETYASFFAKLSKNCPRSAALMAREPYHKDFIPVSSMLPKTLLEYRTPDTLQLPPKELGELCQDFKIEELTLSQVQAVERSTRSQSAGRTWFRQRAGRITASKLKQVLRTNPQQPSTSLIKAICYPEAYRFTTAATRYLGFELG